MVFLLLSMTPSLLPRGPLFQGLVSGVSGSIGYALGGIRGVAGPVHAVPSTSPRPPRWAWTLLVILAAIGVVLGVVYFHYWRDHVRDLAGCTTAQVVQLRAGRSHLGGPALRLRRGRTAHRPAHPLPHPPTSIVLPRRGFLRRHGRGTARRGDRYPQRCGGPRNHEPAQHNLLVDQRRDGSEPGGTDHRTGRSGGPGSLASWASLGHQGRIFLHGGPTVAQLSEFNRAPAKEPIRAYAGLNSAKGIRATAELGRSRVGTPGRPQRKVIAVATTTGTGWINAAEADSLEYMYNGDTAIVSMQYSFLPSWLSFLVDKENARQAGQALFEAVDERVRHSEAQRPKIVVFGESPGRSAARRRS